MDKQLDLKQIREKELELLQHFDFFCKENGIRYYLSNGTLLGAVKYNGFIPWDDDIDVVMLRRDYDTFISKYRDSEYVLFEYSRNSNFRYPFAKLSDPDTLLLESDIDNAVPLGINIDIFPLDNIGSNYDKAKKYALYMHRLSMFLVFSKRKIKYIPSLGIFKNLLHISFGLLSKCLKKDMYIRAIRKKAQKYANDVDSRYVGSLCWSVYKEKEALSLEIFDKTVDVSFEGKQYPAPGGYDIYLSSLYGDYRKDPQPEKQVSHHTFKVFQKI